MECVLGSSLRCGIEAGRQWIIMGSVKSMV